MSLRGWCNAALGAVLLVIGLPAWADVTCSGSTPNKTYQLQNFNLACSSMTQYVGQRGPSFDYWLQIANATVPTAGACNGNGNTAAYTWTLSPDSNSTTQVNRSLLGNGTAFWRVAGMCVATCPSGTTASNGTCILTPPPACQSGDVKHTGTLYQSNTAGGYCAGGCQVTPNASPGGVCVEIGSGSQNSCSFGDSSTTWTANGSACTSGTTSPQLAPVVTTASGETYTLQPQGCGLVNGESFCASDRPAEGGCVQTSGGQLFCTSTAPTPPVPSAPGQPGTPATPSSTVNVTNNNTTTTVNHYNTSVVQAGQTGSGGTGGGGTGGTAGGTTGGGTGGTTGSGTGGTTGGTCIGTPGQPCSVKIDETGIPEGVPDEFGRVIDPEKLGEYDTQADAGIGEIAAGVGEMFSGVAGNIDRATTFSTACTSVTYEVRGVARSVPGIRGCELLDKFKEFASWALGVLVSLSIFITFRDAMSK